MKVPTKALNASVLAALEEGQSGLDKVAQTATDYTRTGIKEGSLSFQILPPEQASDDQLVPCIVEHGEMARFQIFWERQPESAPAKHVALQTVPDGEYITTSMYAIPMARVQTPKIQKEVEELRLTKMNIREILGDDGVKNGLQAIDEKFFDTVDGIVFDSPGHSQPQRVTGKVQWLDAADGLNRDTFKEALKLLNRGNANGQYRLRNHLAVMNEATSKDLLGLDRIEVGGDLAEEHFVNGLKHDKLMGVKTVFTTKDDIVPDDTVYFFAEPRFLGKSFYLYDWTTYMKREATFIEFFSYWMGGFAFGNVAGMAVARFNQQAGS